MKLKTLIFKIQKTLFLKVKKSLLELEKGFEELKDNEPKDRKGRINGEIEELFFLDQLCFYRWYGPVWRKGNEWKRKDLLKTLGMIEQLIVFLIP